MNPKMMAIIYRIFQTRISLEKKKNETILSILPIAQKCTSKHKFHVLSMFFTNIYTYIQRGGQNYINT